MALTPPSTNPAAPRTSCSPGSHQRSRQCSSRVSANSESTPIEINEAEVTEALRDLGLGAVDVVLTQEYEGVPGERNRRFTYTPLVGDRLTLVLPPEMEASTTIEQLHDAPWLLHGRTTRCALATKGVLRAAGITPLGQTP